MKKQNEKVQSYFNQELIDGVKLAAIDSKEWRKLLDKAEGAGEIAGATVLSDTAATIWHVISDKLASVAPVAATFEAPVTTFLIADLQDKVGKAFAAFDLAESALSEGATHVEIQACADLRHAHKEARHVVECLIDFRLLCGVVNAGIKTAQKNATDLARQTCAMAEKGAMATKARDKICKMIKRDLERYGLAVNLQKVEATTCDAKSAHVETDAEKAEKGIFGAFKLDPSAAIGALLKLEATTMATIKNAIERAQKAAQVETAQQDSEHKEGAVETLTENMDGMPTDMVTVANAGESAALAAQHLADLVAQGVTPEQEADLKAASKRGRKVVGL